MGTVNTWVGVVAATALVVTLAPAAHAARHDSDRDGIPDRWERSHGMNPNRAADARRDFDRDHLSNRVEYRLRIRIRDEDSDDDGLDDGDEVRDGYRATVVDDRDSNDDGQLDGDEDSDRDSVDDEDEDDARERCRYDDDDRDRDDVDDEDENELRLRVGDRNSDDDGVPDGLEDRDGDGVANEDEDDSEVDACDGDSDDDGEDDEDENDRFGVIESFDAESGTLVVSRIVGGTTTGTVTDDTEIDFEDAPEYDDVDEPEATVEDLRPGVVVAELEFDDETGDLEEVEIYQS